MDNCCCVNVEGIVALREEGVDRNVCVRHESSAPAVALREEGVDRNFVFRVVQPYQWVALREEGVDRNADVCKLRYIVIRRPPRGGRG